MSKGISLLLPLKEIYLYGIHVGQVLKHLLWNNGSAI